MYITSEKYFCIILHYLVAELQQCIFAQEQLSNVLSLSAIKPQAVLILKVHKMVGKVRLSGNIVKLFIGKVSMVTWFKKG